VALPSRALTVPGLAVISEAGVGGGLWPHRPGARTEIPAAFRFPAAVSRRTPISFSMRRKVQPSWPKAMPCFFSSLKTLLTFTERKPRPD
jgi:hypothetical protein